MNKLFLLIFIWKTTFSRIGDGKYFQLLNDFSYNSKQPKTYLTAKQTYKTYNDSILYPSNIILLPNIKNSTGMIQTTKQITPSNFELQLKLKINPSLGALCYSWFYSHSTHNVHGVLIFSDPNAITKILFYESANTTIDNINIDHIINNADSYQQGGKYCMEYISNNKYTLFTFRLFMNEFFLYYNTPTHLLYSCFSYVNSKYNEGKFEGPFTIAIGGRNEHNKYQSEITISKISIFNRNEQERYNYVYYPRYKVGEDDDNDDVIEKYCNNNIMNWNDVNNSINDVNEHVIASKMNVNNSLFVEYLDVLYERNSFVNIFINTMILKYFGYEHKKGTAIIPNEIQNIFTIINTHNYNTILFIRNNIIPFLKQFTSLTHSHHNISAFTVSSLSNITSTIHSYYTWYKYTTIIELILTLLILILIILLYIRSTKYNNNNTFNSPFNIKTITGSNNKSLKQK